MAEWYLAGYGPVDYGLSASANVTASSWTNLEDEVNAQDPTDAEIRGAEALVIAVHKDGGLQYYTVYNDFDFDSWQDFTDYIEDTFISMYE
jgi:hypothetical protein